jgi:hypothetical protein
MRAFASCADQTRPTINLHGEELAIGPASTDPHGEWGIHVQPPVDGRAQELREALQLAARLLAGSKGNPPRLQDEVPEFEDRATNSWDPHSKMPKKSEVGNRTVFGHSGTGAPSVPEPSYYEPAMGAPTSDSAEILSSGASRSKLNQKNFRKTPPFWADVYERPELEQGASPERMSPPPTANAPVPPTGHAPAPKRANRRTAQYNGVRVEPAAAPVIAAATIRKPKKQAAKTAFGFLPSEAPKETFAATASKTMPLGLTLDKAERTVLNELGRQPFLTPAMIADVLGVAEPMEWMARFMDKLAEFGLDLVAPGPDQDGEPTYQLIR